MASKKDMNIKIMPDQVVYTNISRSKEGYNSARMVVKANEKEYMSISYEWEGDGIPDFALSLMGFMQANALEVGKEYEPDAIAKCGGGGKKKKAKKGENMQDKIEDEAAKKPEKMCPDCKKPMSKCTCKKEDMEGE